MSQTVTIFKQAVLDDIDAITYKRANVSKDTPAKQAYEAISESSDEFDKGILHRLMNLANARLCKSLQSVLVDDEDSDEEDDDLLETIEQETFVYVFGKKLSKTMLKSVEEFIHIFLVRFAANEWYKQMGLTALFDEDELDYYKDQVRFAFMSDYVPTKCKPF